MIPLLGLVPPESRGVALAGAATLIFLLAGLRAAAPVGGRGWIIAAAALAAASALAAEAPSAAVEPLSTALLAAALGVAAASLPGEAGVGRRVAGAAAVTGGVVALHALWQTLFGLDRLAAEVALRDLPDRQAILDRIAGGRAFAGFPTPAALAAFLALTLPLALGRAADARGWRRAAWAGAAAIQIGAFLAAASGTAAVALTGAVLLALAWWSRARRWLLAGGALAALVLAGVAVQRASSILDPGGARSPLRLRAANARAAWEMAADRPWIGVGAGGFAEAYPRYRRSGDNETRHAHDLPLELAAELGWPAGLSAAALFFALFLAPLRWAARESSGWRRGAAIGLAAFALHNLADFTAWLPSVCWTAALLCGVLAGGRKLARAAPPPRPALAGAALAVTLVAALAAGLGGLARDRRVAAREAAWAGEAAQASELAAAAARLAPWDIDAALAAAAAALGPEVGGAAEPPDPSAALDLAERAVRLSPGRPGARVLRARARLAAGDAPGALVDLSEASRLYPLHEDYARSRDRLREGLAEAFPRPGVRP